MQKGCAKAEAGDKAYCKKAGSHIREDGAFIEAGENDNLIVSKLEANPNALGVFGFSFLDQNRDSIQGSVIGGVEPTFEAIASGDRPRYEIVEGRIRALYGHSIAVEPGEPSRPPETLYVGLSARDAERAERYGLRGGRRRFLHLALTEDGVMARRAPRY